MRHALICCVSNYSASEVLNDAIFIFVMIVFFVLIVYLVSLMLWLMGLLVVAFSFGIPDYPSDAYLPIGLLEKLVFRILTFVV